MATEVKYQEKPYEVVMRPVERRGILQIAPGQSQMGYGKKISTDRMIKLPGDHRLRRVYAICYSNAASHYILKGGELYFLHGYDLD